MLITCDVFYYTLGWMWQKSPCYCRYSAMSQFYFYLLCAYKLHSQSNSNGLLCKVRTCWFLKRFPVGEVSAKLSTKYLFKWELVWCIVYIRGGSLRLIWINCFRLLIRVDFAALLYYIFWTDFVIWFSRIIHFW